MTAFTKKPVTIDAFRWTGRPDQEEDPVWICDAIRDGIVQFVEAGFMSIHTTEGVMNASPGDWIIRGIEGELYPCKDSVFQATYSPAGLVGLVGVGLSGPGGDTHTGLPVSSYRPQTSDKVETVNANKEAEEQVLRILDGLAGRPEIDKRFLAIGRTYIEMGFMAINRAVFQPGRVSLPGDVPALAAETVPDTASQDLRSRGEPRVPRHDAPPAA